MSLRIGFVDKVMNGHNNLGIIDLDNIRAGVELIEAPVVEELVEFVEYLAKRAMAIDQVHFREVDRGCDGSGLAHVHDLLDSAQIDFLSAEFDAIERTRSNRNLLAAAGSVDAAPHWNSSRDLAHGIHGLFLTRRAGDCDCPRLFSDVEWQKISQCVEYFIGE